MLVAHVEQAGVWQIEGGMHALAAALGRLLLERGVTIRCATTVRRLDIHRGRIVAVETADDDRLPVHGAVVTCDAAAVAAGLLGDPAAVGVPVIPVEQRSLSAITWTGAARADGVGLLRHNVFFSADYGAEFDALARQSPVPTHPTVYVCAQDRETRCPPADGEAERLLCLINAPATGDRHEYHQQEVELCLKAMLSTLNQCGLRLQTEPSALTVTTPSDFHRLFPGSGGALYGQASHGWRASFRRPGVRTATRGLYLAGGSTHPGPGLPMALLSARHAVRCLLQDRGSRHR
jgi:1-hydroxycarotenoid 3,4-desaturase